MKNNSWKKSKKYETSGLIEAQYEPGSRRRVLRNLLGIKRKRVMDRAEYDAQITALFELTTLYGMDHRFGEKDICRIHRLWLGEIYPWAGNFRQVNMTKGGFTFAAAHTIPYLMKEFEEKFLKQYTPCCSENMEHVVRSIAVVHTELVLIHPFREGNGRLARLLAILMGLQAQLPPLDFGGINGKKRLEYFSAVRAGLNRDYQPMSKIFQSIIKRTLKNLKR